MSCQGFDWKAYALDELSGADKKLHDGHLRGCNPCRAELDELKGTLLLVHRLPVAEPPRRIAFVSDPVFEPSWWQRLWSGSGRLAFAGSGVLAAAIVAHGFLMRPPAPIAAPAVVAQAPAQAMDEKRIQEEVDKRVNAALKNAVAELKVQQNESTQRLVSALERKIEVQRQRDLRDVDSSFSYLQKQMGTLYVNTSRMGGD